MPNIETTQKMLFDKNLEYTMNTMLVMFYDMDGMYFGKADATNSTAFDIAATLVEKRGGPSNLALFNIPADKALTYTVDSLDFDFKRLSLVTGDKIRIGKHIVESKRASVNVVKTGTNPNITKMITMPEKPVGKHFYIDNASPIAIPIPDGSATMEFDVTTFVPDGIDCVSIVYAAENVTERINIGGDTPPAILKAIMVADVFNSKTGAKTKEFKIVVPKSQSDGNLNIAGALGDSNNQSMTFKALAVPSSECGSTQQTLGYFEVSYTNQDDIYNGCTITATKEIELAVSEVDDIVVSAIKGSSTVFDGFTVTDMCTFATDKESIATVDAKGKVTAVAQGAAVITTSFSGMTATTNVTVTAAP